jgi:hypothetical protein
MESNSKEQSTAASEADVRTATRGMMMIHIKVIATSKGR